MPMPSTRRMMPPSWDASTQDQRRLETVRRAAAAVRRKREQLAAAVTKPILEDGAGPSTVVICEANQGRG